MNNTPSRNSHWLLLAVMVFMIAPGSGNATTTNLYASVRASIFVVDDGKNTRASVENNYSRLGFKGKEDLSNRISVIGHYEIGVDAEKDTFGDNEIQTRLAYLKLNTGVGDFSIGSQWGAYYLSVGSITDQYNTLGASHINPTFRLSRSLGYSVKLGLAKIKISAVLKNSENEDDVIDRFQIGTQFHAGIVVIAAGLDSLAKSETGTSKGNAFSVGAILKKNRVTLAASFTNTDAPVATKNAGTSLQVDTDNISVVINNETHEAAKKSTELYVAYDLGNGAKLSLLFGQSDIQYQDRTETTISATPNTITLGYQKKISQATRWWLEGELEDSDVIGADEQFKIALGFRHDWNIVK